MDIRIDTSLPCDPANYTPGRAAAVTHIVVHYTGGPGSAKANASYFHGNGVGASAHYFLDGGGVVYQSVDPADTAWAVGAWSGARQLVSNAQSISIEVCNDGGPFTAAEVDELMQLVPELMERYGVPAENVVRHWDCHTGRKECPAYYAGEGNAAWALLHANITEGANMASVEEIAAAVWNFEQKGVKMRDRVQGTDAAANQASTAAGSILRAVQTEDRSGRTKGGTGINTRFSYFMNGFDALVERVEALDAKIDALAALLEDGGK